MKVQGWSAEMDRKLQAMRKDPGDYFERAYREARETSTGWRKVQPRKRPQSR